MKKFTKIQRIRLLEGRPEPVLPAPQDEENVAENCLGQSHFLAVKFLVRVPFGSSDITLLSKYAY